MYMYVGTIISFWQWFWTAIVVSFTSITSFRATMYILFMTYICGRRYPEKRVDWENWVGRIKLKTKNPKTLTHCETASDKTKNCKEVSLSVIIITFISTSSSSSSSVVCRQHDWQYWDSFDWPGGAQWDFILPAGHQPLFSTASRAVALPTRPTGAQCTSTQLEGWEKS